jgi:hypothetical protein
MFRYTRSPSLYVCLERTLHSAQGGPYKSVYFLDLYHLIKFEDQIRLLNDRKSTFSYCRFITVNDGELEA